MSGQGSVKDEKICLVDEHHDVDWKPNRRNRRRNRRTLCVMCFAIVLVGLIVVAVAVGTTVGKSSSSASVSDPWLNVRLPSNIQPRAYDLSLTVDLSKFTVQGRVIISADVQAATPYVILHALNMDISSASVSTGTISKQFFYTENEFYVIVMTGALSAGRSIDITLNFNYNLTAGLAGFYKSSYTINGTTAYLATTQFEPTDARRAFPCFDEPAFKANFTVHITHDCQYTAVSNMPVSSIAGNPSCTTGNFVTTNFQTSVKMSTYLVAFIVSQFNYINSSTGGTTPVEVSVWSNPDVLNKTSLALKVGVEALNFYNSYYGIPYPLKKQDLFAIPDFSAGAMENWGLITYRETALLYDNTTGPVSSKQRVAVVIAHELAHQWFGDLVTMAWWDGLWLNEGFATFMEYLGTNNSFPEWNMLNQFFTDVIQVAMLEDGLNETHPIIQPVSTPAQINELFDAISYEKGGSVIRMIRDWMGEEKFRQGIQSYLKTYAYQNAATDMLWQSLQQQESTYNISSIMDTWTKQMGYPVVTVKRTSSTTASVSQERFFFLKPNGTIAPSPYNYVWKIPFKYITSPSGNVTSHLIEPTTDTITLDQSQTWIKANVQQMGFYRVNYEQANWESLTDYLRTSDWALLTTLDRAGLLDDAFALSSAGLLDTTTAFNVSTYLLQETEYVPWVAALTWIDIFADRLSLTPIYGQYQNYILSLLAKVTSQYTLYNSSSNLTDVQNLLRASVLSAAFRYGNSAVTQEAAVLFQSWKNNNSVIDPNIKAVVYSAGIALGTEDDWNFMWNKFLVETDPYEKRLYISALAKSTQPWILNRYLGYSLSDYIRSQDTLTVIQAVSSTVNGRYLAWYFVRNNWNVLLSRYGTASFSLTGLIRVITEAFSTELELNEVQEFFAAHPDAGSGTRALLQSIENIKANILWVNNNQNSLGTWLNWWNTR